MSLKSILIRVSSSICAISLLISVSITYFSYDTNTSVTKETDGHIEAVSFCGSFNKQLSYNMWLELVNKIKLSDIVEFDEIEANQMDSLKFYLMKRVCFRLIDQNIYKNIPLAQLHSSNSFRIFRTSPLINRTIFGKQRIAIILHSPYEIPGEHLRPFSIVRNVRVSFTRVVHLPEITCTNINNRYDDSREACVRRQILLQCPNFQTLPVFDHELEQLNKSVNSGLIFPFRHNQQQYEYEQKCRKLMNDQRFGKCHKLTECVQYYAFNIRSASSPRSVKSFLNIKKGVETLVEYSLKLNLRDYIIEILSIFATTYGWSVLTLRSIARKRIKFIVLRKFVKLIILTIAISGLMYQCIDIITDYANYDSRTELRLSKTDRHLQLPFFDICSDRENTSLDSRAVSFGNYQIVPPITVYFNKYIVCQRHQLLKIVSDEDSYDINSIIVSLTIRPQLNEKTTFLGITIHDQVFPLNEIGFYKKYDWINALRRYQTQLLHWPYKGNCYNYQEVGFNNRRDCLINCMKTVNINISTLIKTKGYDRVCDKCSRPDCYDIRFGLHNTGTKWIDFKPYSLLIQHADVQQEIIESEKISTGNFVLLTLGIIGFWLGLSAIGLTNYIMKPINICSRKSSNKRRKMRKIVLALNKFLICLCCIFSSMTLLIIYFNYEISTSSEVIESLRIPIEAMDIKCYTTLLNEDINSRNVLMQKFIKMFKTMEIFFISESRNREIFRTELVTYYMRCLRNTTMMVAHVEFNKSMSNIHVRRLYSYNGILISIVNSRNTSLCQPYLTLTTRNDISTMNSESEIRLFSTTTYLQRISQQLLPSPYVTMCSSHITSRVTCLDRCLHFSFNNEGRLVEINRTLTTKIRNQETIVEKCRKQCARRPCFGSFFGSLKYIYNNMNRIGFTLTEQKLVTRPKMAFDELFVYLLQVIGIWIGFGISDFITSLTNVIIWLHSQRLSHLSKRTPVGKWVSAVSGS